MFKVYSLLNFSFDVSYVFVDKDYVTKLVEAERARLELDASIQTATGVSQKAILACSSLHLYLTQKPHLQYIFTRIFLRFCEEKNDKNKECFFLIKLNIRFFRNHKTLIFKIIFEL